jgi:glycine/D-amino acid oxidase-like deaminating enzyme
MAASLTAAKTSPLWWAKTSLPSTTRSQLSEDLQVDVAIVGAGFSGLWAAYYLKLSDPHLSVMVLEAGCVGFGASGRNGGWCSGLFPASWGTVARESSDVLAAALARHMRETVDVVGEFAIDHQLDIDWQKGGTLLLAHDRLQLERAQAHVTDEIQWGNEGMRLLGAPEVRELCKAPGLGGQITGGSFNPHCAAINPAKLVTGLARVVEGLGVRIFERSRVDSITPRTSQQDHRPMAEVGELRVGADVILRATEGYTPLLPGFKRDLAPVYSLMIATEPLDEQTWAQIGLANRETFADYGNLIIYGQRTADGRLAFGGRGAPYHFGSKVRAGFDQDDRVHRNLANTLVRWFPVLADKRIDYRWGGPLGVPRDWYAGVRFDPTTGLGSVGGYVGDGVGSSNLAGRIFADLITEKDSELTHLPWVNRPVKRWEPEPLRWLGINAGLSAASAADWYENRVGASAPWATALGKLTGD